MKPLAPVLPGETLDGKYRVERILGQGGMGVVVAAKHIDLDERVAIKFLLGEPSPEAVDRFLREARAAVKVKGEHVCRVLDFGRLDTGEPYIVMEHLEGMDLARKIDNEGAQTPSAAVGWIIEASDALAEAHALGIVHRDVKPANVFLATRRDGTSSAKVLDFGISKLPSLAQLTGAQTPMGTPAYMSPEQMASARDVDARTDIWSLGVTLYELLSGVRPFVGDSIVQLTVQVREKELARLERIPDDLWKVLAKCLAKDPADRYESVEALVAALAPFATDDVAGLVARHARRESLARGAPPAPALTALVARVEVAVAGESVKRDAERVGTFGPLQSTFAGGRGIAGTRRRSWSRLALAAGVAGVLGATAAVVSRSSPSIPTVSDVREAAPLVERVGPDDGARAPLVAPVGPSAVANAAASAASSAGASAVSIAVKPPASHVRPPTFPTATLLAPDAAVALPPSAMRAPPTKPDPRKRRELDREDP